MRENIRIAGVQMNVEIAETEQNLVKIFEAMKTAAGEGADLAVFPECALTGYCFQDLQEARAYAQLVPGPRLEASDLGKSGSWYLKYMTMQLARDLGHIPSSQSGSSNRWPDRRPRDTQGIRSIEL